MNVAFTIIFLEVLVLECLLLALRFSFRFQVKSFGHPFFLFFFVLSLLLLFFLLPQLFYFRIPFLLELRPKLSVWLPSFLQSCLVLDSRQQRRLKWVLLDLHLRV